MRQGEDMTLRTNMVSSMGAAMVAAKMREPMSAAIVSEVLPQYHPLTRRSSDMTLTSVRRLILNTLWNLMSLKDTIEVPSGTIETHAISRCILSGLNIVTSSNSGDTSILGPMSMTISPKYI